MQKQVSDKKKDPQRRMKMGLANSTALATLLTVLGHTLLGFEQSLFQVVVAIVTGYSTSMLLESVDAWADDRKPRFMGKGFLGWVQFMLSNHMTSITLSFLVYAGSKTSVMAFAVAAGIASKYFFRVTVDGKKRHFFNPSNFGIALTLMVFPFVNTLPYQFTEWLSGRWDWLVTAIVFALGFRLNLMFTGRLLLISSWLLGFIAQGIIRSLVFGTPLAPELMTMSGPAFILFTFYMITDPMTSPESKKSQIIFGLSLAATYGLLLAMHIANQIFLCVVLVTGFRGILLWWNERARLKAFDTKMVSPLNARPELELVHSGNTYR